MTVEAIEQRLERVEAALRDALAIERTAQEQTRTLSATRREVVERGGEVITPEERDRMETIMADAAEAMADRLAEVVTL